MPEQIGGRTAVVRPTAIDSAEVGLAVSRDGGIGSDGGAVADDIRDRREITDSFPNLPGVGVGVVVGVGVEVGVGVGDGEGGVAGGVDRGWRVSFAFA